MDRLQYLALMAACAVGTLPLEWLLRARVYRQPRRLLRTLWLPVVVFCAWDAIAIARGDWSFDGRYVTGWRLPFSIPVEELAFFVVIPICALLSLEACRFVLRERRA
jgi:lycopene cyclase domain-containing protein